MTTQLDYSVGIGKETSYSVAVPPTRWAESEATMKLEKTPVQGSGMRPNKQVDRKRRRSIARKAVTGDITLDAPTSGLGMFLEAALGTVTSTLVSGSTYQQVHTLRKTDPMPSYTVQEVLPVLGGGAGSPHTFAGCVADTLDIEVKEGGYVSIKLGWLGKSLDTATAATATSYSTTDELFAFVDGTIKVGAGALTAPTTTAPASHAGTANVNVTELSVSLKRNYDTGGWNLGGAGLRSRQPVLGKAAITGSFTAEYTDNTLRDAYLNDTQLRLLLTLTHGAGVLQVALPAIFLNGEVPSSNGGQPITQTVPFDVLDDETAAEPIWVVYVSGDTAV